MRNVFQASLHKVFCMPIGCQHFKSLSLVPTVYYVDLPYKTSPGNHTVYKSSGDSNKT